MRKGQQTTVSKSKSTKLTSPNIFFIGTYFMKMSESKFSELRKFLQKLVDIYFPQCKGEKKSVFDLFAWKESENFRKQVKHLRQLSLSRPVQLIIRRKDKPRQVFIRYLSLPSQVKDVTFWKSLFPRNIPRRQVWGRSSHEASVPQFSRGFKRMDSLGPINENQVRDSKAFDQVRKAMTDDLLEQKYYTEKKSSRRVVEEENMEIPPRQKCRLACPLPPQEFEPSLTQEYIPHYQPPTVKYPSIPTRLLPERKRRAAYDSRYSLDAQTRNQKRRKQTEEWLNFEPKNVKNYLNLQQVKSQLYRQNPEKPTMKALLFEPDSLALSFDSVSAPTKIFKDEVVIQIAYSGVCGTDLFIMEGKLECGVNPLILGHEISGKVYATGSDVIHVQKNDKVAVNPYTACCCCRYCSRGMFASCLNEGVRNSIGVTKNGGWAEFIVVKKSQVFKIPDDMGLEEAAMLQPLSRVLNAISKLNLQEGFVFIIQGLGLSGLLWASVLHSKGFNNVYVTDKNKHRVRTFEAMGLGYPAIETDELGKYTADVVVETSGSPAFIEKSFSILNPNGQLCFFGKPNPLTEIRCFPYEIVNKEISIVGRCGNDFCFSKAIDLATIMGRRYLDFEKLGVSLFSLEDYEFAFKKKKSGEVGKVMFRFNS